MSDQTPEAPKDALQTISAILDSLGDISNLKNGGEYVAEIRNETLHVDVSANAEGFNFYIAKPAGRYQFTLDVGEAKFIAERIIEEAKRADELRNKIETISAFVAESILGWAKMEEKNERGEIVWCERTQQGDDEHYWVNLDFLRDPKDDNLVLRKIKEQWEAEKIQKFESELSRMWNMRRSADLSEKSRYGASIIYYCAGDFTIAALSVMHGKSFSDLPLKANERPGSAFDDEIPF